jgi:hypothetical protein
MLVGLRKNLILMDRAQLFHQQRWVIVTVWFMKIEQLRGPG